MNKTFQRIFAKAKSENKSCFVGFVTGMDPDYESSKQILIELSKYCSVLEIGVSFNTSTSDSSIIMSANDRAIKSGAKTEKIFQLIKDVKKEKHCDIIFSIERITQDSKNNNIDFYNHITHLIIHSFLHINNFIHYKLKDFFIMKKIETKILKKLGIQDPY